MNFNYKKIFITGANGWLGKQLVKTLMEGDNEVIEDFNLHKDIIVNCLLLPEDDASFFQDYKENVNIVRGDIRNKQDLQYFFNDGEGGLFIHTAGIIHPKRIKEFFEINVEGTKNLIEAAIYQEIKKIVVISSNSPLGCNPTRNELFDENSPYNPYMNYGKSKWLMEKYLLRKINEGIDITILRPPWFYGENMPERQILFYKMVKSGKVPIVGDGNNLRSMANVKNIVQGILLAASKPISKGQIYWIADQQPYTMNEIIKTIRNVLEKEFKINCKDSFIKLPFFLGQFAQFCDLLVQSIGFYNQKIHVLSEMNKNIACKIDKAKKELDYEPKVDLYKGTKDALENDDIKL